MKSIVKRFVVAGLALMAAGLPATAQLLPLRFSPLAQYNGFDPLLGHPAVRLGDGSYAVVWNESFQQARLQWVRPDGSQILPPGGLALGATLVGLPAVAAHPAGGAFVAIPLQTGTGSRIVVQSFDRNASPLWGAGVTAVDLPEIEYQTYPQLLTSPQGGVYVCFVRTTPSAPASPSRLACQYLSADGRPLWVGGRVTETDLGSRVDPPLLLPDAGGGALVFWSRAVSTTAVITDTSDLQNPIYLKGQRFNPEGTPLWGEGGKQLHLTNWWDLTFSSIRSFAVPDGQGGAILAFPSWHVQTAPPLAEEVVAQRINGDGAPLWGDGTTVAAGTDYPTIDSLTALPNGGAAAVVQRLLTPSRFQLVLSRLGPGGRARPAQPIVLSVPNRDQQDGQSQGSFDDGRLRILWNSRGVFESFHAEVRIAVFDAASRRLTAPDAPPFAAGVATGGHYLSGFAFDAKRQQGLALWNDYTSADGLTAPAGALFGGDVGVR
jgi:hypothetical protein